MPATLQRMVALVVIDVVGPADHAGRGSRSGRTADAVTEAAQPLHGTVLRDDVHEHVVAFPSVARAVEFAARVHESAGLRGSARVGIHVGDVTHRDGEVFGTAVRSARRLAGRAVGGQTLVSRVVRDLVVGDRELVEVHVDSADRSRHAYAVGPPHQPPEPAREQVPERIVSLLDEQLAAARVLLVLGPAGSGKTTAVRALTERRPTVWLPVPAHGIEPAVLARALVSALRIRVPGLPSTLAELAGGMQESDLDAQRQRAETLATSVGQALADHLPRELTLVVDGVDRLDASPGSVVLLEALARNAPPPLHLLLVGRRDPGLRLVRMQEAGVATTLAEGQLRLSAEEIQAIVGAGHTGGGPSEQLVTLAAGDPEAARLLASGWRRGIGELAAGPEAMAASLVASLDEHERLVLTSLISLGRSSPAVLDAVVGAASSAALDRLRAAGMVRFVADGPELEVGSATAAALPVDPDRRRRCATIAARHLVAAGEPVAALEALLPLGPRTTTVEVLLAEGRRVLAEGGWPQILAALGGDAQEPAALDDLMPDAGPSERVTVAGIIGEAWRLAGDGATALAWLSEATAEAEQVPSWLAWRMGILLHFAGDPTSARALYARCAPGGEVADQALVHAWDAAAAWMQSDIEACTAHTQMAMDLARQAQDGRALAAAHTVRAMLAATGGDRAANDQHYLQALDHAERAGDLLQQVRIRTNRGSRLLEEGEHIEALAELEVALRMAEVSGAAAIHGMALSNRGQVLRRLGRLDEATADLSASRDILERIGSRWAGYALGHLGDVYRLRGERTQARSCYEEALALCEPVGDTQGTVPALTGLALLMLSHDVHEARALAERACAAPKALGHVAALAALAEVALATGDRDVAGAATDEGVATARERRDSPGLARHLELQAQLSDVAASRSALLREARAMWERMGCALELARADTLLATSEWTSSAFAVAEQCIQTLREHGARAWADEGEARLNALREDAATPLHVRVLGGLRLQRGPMLLTDGQLPPPDVLDLLAYLAVQGERLTTAARAAAALWPEDPAAPARLRQAEVDLAAFVTALGGDPDGVAGLRLDPGVVSSDVRSFLLHAARGLGSHRDGATAAAEIHLSLAEASYGGELLAGMPVRSWIETARDDAAEAYLQVVMTLVELAEARGDGHGAVRSLLRVLEHDPYDETAHLRLVACLERAGRRGEARRRYRAYAARMDEIGVEPAPFPDLSVEPR